MSTLTTPIALDIDDHLTDRERDYNPDDYTIDMVCPECDLLHSADSTECDNCHCELVTL